MSTATICAAGQLLGQTDGNSAAAGADIENLHRRSTRKPALRLQRHFHQQLRFRSRDQNIGRDKKIQRPEFFMTGDIGNRFALRAPQQQFPELASLSGAYRRIAVHVKLLFLQIQARGATALPRRAGCSRSQPGVTRCAPHNNAPRMESGLSWAMAVSTAVMMFALIPSPLALPPDSA